MADEPAIKPRRKRRASAFAKRVGALIKSGKTFKQAVQEAKGGRGGNQRPRKASRRAPVRSRRRRSSRVPVPARASKPLGLTARDTAQFPDPVMTGARTIPTNKGSIQGIGRRVASLRAGGAFEMNGDFDGVRQTLLATGRI